MHDTPRTTHARIAEHATRWSAIALGVSIPVSVALDNVLLALVAAGWALSGDWRAKWRAVRDNPVALAAAALFALLAVGTLHGDRYPGDAARYLGKYADLLFVVPFVWVFREAEERRLALLALAGSLALVLALSWLLWLGILPPMRPFVGNSAVPSVFKRYLTHNILMAFGAFLFAELACTTATRMRLLWTALAVLAVVNVSYQMPGGTGQAILLLLLVYWGYSWRGWRGTVIMLAALVALAVVLMVTPSSFNKRLALFGKQFQAWELSGAANTSTGKRIEYYRNSIGIVAAHPLTGVGTGSFPKAYAEKMQGTGEASTRNPHNEYLLIAVQVGIPGLILFLFLLCAQWLLAGRIPVAVNQHLVRALVLTIGTGCLLNSLLLDHTEGLFYAWLSGVLYGGLRFGDEL